jgi:hypothetical protein
MNGPWLPSRFVAAVLLCAGAALSHARAVDVNAAGSLGEKYAKLRTELSNNQFQKPLYLDSREAPDSASGDVYAVVDHPFATTAAALSSGGNWCEILFLQVNTKYCRVSTGGEGSVLDARIGRKYDQPVDQAYRVAFSHRVAARTPDYLQVELSADQGPLGTRNYRIVLEAIPVEKDRTFIRFSYSYGFGTMGRLAMQIYLGTTGKDKVGFTVTGKHPDGQPMHIGGMRGIVERNSMRYYLAIEAFLGSLSAPPQAQLEKRLRDWFAASERYPRQLHEIGQAEYLEMKRKEYLRQQAGPLVGRVAPTSAEPASDPGS